MGLLSGAPTKRFAEVSANKLTVTGEALTLDPMRLRGAAVALLLIVGIITSSVATCVADAAAPQQQMACCKAGHKTCGQHGTPADCCKTTPHGGGQFTTVGQISAPQPTPTVWQALSFAPLPSAALFHRPLGIVDASSPPGTKHPTYLVLSILRL